MSGIDNQPKQKKVVYAPSPSAPSLFSSIYSIELNEGEQVEWQWLELPDGSRVVTNYKIISQRESR